METKDYASAVYIPIAWELFHRDTRSLAHKLMAKGPFKGIVAITRGGLIPSSIIARELDIRVIESVGVATYDDRTQSSGVQILKELNRDLVGDGEGWLVVDDLVDSGVTARAVKAMLPKAHMATVYAKPEGQKETDTFVVAVRQDVWLLFPWDADLQPNEPLVRRQRDLEVDDVSIGRPDDLPSQG
ncbi:xanthine phosphoribosyltransferase [Rhodospirillum rubrum]|uniref:xanthine phosphoribosyltransferase n=1 Tax=Rhodospirillum rubrum TaxID=1085 RepID=UPI001904FDE0|nr:xanthine phosphoribosyltransferase [Rhodospirillum rubrum]MBK1666190.1 xanthine phosphoribosyltransferase [Rhodospirillum rubrum]MBK1678327.1 xanthine phosphoribosyltransferase [Rhodospirillum rubrum]